MRTEKAAVDAFLLVTGTYELPPMHATAQYSPSCSQLLVGERVSDSRLKVPRWYAVYRQYQANECHMYRV